MGREERLYVIIDMHCRSRRPDRRQHRRQLAAIPGSTTARRSRRISSPSGNASRVITKTIPPSSATTSSTNPSRTFPRLAPYNQNLEPLYKKLTAAIRQVDTHHIIFLGGAQWDGNFTVFGPPFDNNITYTFHKYWSKTDEPVIQPYLDFREKYNVPIWLGESGENTDEWIAQFVALMEKHNIGWAFWPYKKMGKTSAVVTITPPKAGIRS